MEQARQKFLVRHVRINLEGMVPIDFTYHEIDLRLVDNNGCSITAPGVLALDPASSILQQINVTVHAMFGACKHKVT